MENEASRPQFGPIISADRIERLIEDYKAIKPDGILRTDDGVLRCYYAGFDLSALAVYLSENLNKG